MKRVVITSMGAVSPYGAGVDALFTGLMEGRSAVTADPCGQQIQGLRAAVSSRVPEVDAKVIDRKFRRSMSRAGVYAALAAREAWAGAGVDVPAGPGCGVSIGSTTASPDALEAIFAKYIGDQSLEQIKSTQFFQIMSHNVSANVAQLLGLQGRSLSPAAACATGCQSVGLAAEAIRFGKERAMLAGGADELHPMTLATFDIINAASIAFNGAPEKTPRPFAADRDGVVCGEGAGLLLLEELEGARARGATILAEVLGFATTCDTANFANPDGEAMRRCMAMALEDAGLRPDRVDYVNAHATGTVQGDEAECHAISALFGPETPASSLKGHLGHTMAAAGALELISVVRMIGEGVLLPTRNLDRVDPALAPVDHITEIRRRPVEIVLKNSFAMGGVNSSVVLGRFADG